MFWKSYIDEDYAKIVGEKVAQPRSQDFDTQLNETLKFLCITSMNSGRRQALNEECDDVWHMLILQTRPYFELCDRLPGGKFLHHSSQSPADYSVRVGDSKFVREWVMWLPDYVHHFGPFTEETSECWVVCDFFKKRMGWSVQEINAFGESNSPDVTFDPRANLITT